MLPPTWVDACTNQSRPKTGSRRIGTARPTVTGALCGAARRGRDVQPLQWHGNPGRGHRLRACQPEIARVVSTPEGDRIMPAKTEKQRKFMGAELQRKREGKKTRTEMSEK